MTGATWLRLRGRDGGPVKGQHFPKQGLAAAVVDVEPSRPLPKDHLASRMRLTKLCLLRAVAVCGNKLPKLARHVSRFTGGFAARYAARMTSCHRVAASVEHTKSGHVHAAQHGEVPSQLARHSRFRETGGELHEGAFVRQAQTKDRVPIVLEERRARVDEALAQLESHSSRRSRQPQWRRAPMPLP